MKQETKIKKKNKYSIYLLIGIFIFSLYFGLQATDAFTYPTFYSIVASIILAFACEVMVYYLFKFSGAFEKFHNFILIFSENFFKGVMIPAMFLTLPLLGAISSKFPTATSTLLTDASKNFQMMYDSLLKSTMKYIGIVYDLGTNRPEFWLILIPIILIISIYFAIRNTIIEMKQPKDDVQSIIDNLTKEDYKELAEYEKDIALSLIKKGKSKSKLGLFILIIIGVVLGMLALRMYFDYFPDLVSWRLDDLWKLFG